MRHVDPGAAVPWQADDPKDSHDARYAGVKQDDRCSMLTPDEILRAREVGRITRDAVDHALSLLKEGITTDEIDESVHHLILSYGAYPSFLNYRGFPKSMATNINEVVTLGIPDLRPIEAGDVITVVLACFRDGLHCAASETAIVGGAEMEEGMTDDSSTFSRLERSRRLICAARDAFEEAKREASKAGATIGDVGSAIHSVAESYGYRAVQRLTGHGIGTKLQCPPHIEIDNIESLKPGMMLSIAPTLVEGHSACASWSNGFTSCTVDGGMGSQFGATVLVTEGGAEVLTGASARR